MRDVVCWNSSHSTHHQGECRLQPPFIDFLQPNKMPTIDFLIFLVCFKSHAGRRMLSLSVAIDLEELLLLLMVSLSIVWEYEIEKYWRVVYPINILFNYGCSWIFSCLVGLKKTWILLCSLDSSWLTLQI